MAGKKAAQRVRAKKHTVKKASVTNIRKPKGKSGQAKATLSTTPDSTQASPAMPCLKALKVAGATAVDVHYHGHGDDGCYAYRVIGGSKNLPLKDDAETEIEEFLRKHFYHDGIGPGSVLLARFDLIKGVCHGYSGSSGNPATRLGELLRTLESHGVKLVVGELESAEFSKCKVNPAAAYTRGRAADDVNWFLRLAREYRAEYSDFDEEAGYDGKEYRLLDDAIGVLRIDVSKRRVTWARRPASQSIALAVENLAETTLPIRLT
jgi:hypothetical protein